MPRLKKRARFSSSPRRGEEFRDEIAHVFLSRLAKLIKRRGLPLVAARRKGTILLCSATLQLPLSCSIIKYLARAAYVELAHNSGAHGEIDLLIKINSRGFAILRAKATI